MLLYKCLFACYGPALFMTVISKEEFVCIAWDAAGVTTGIITVPIVVTLGLAFGGVLDVVDCFGLLSLASVGPILSVLSYGLFKMKQEGPRTHDIQSASGTDASSDTNNPLMIAAAATTRNTLNELVSRVKGLEAEAAKVQGLEADMKRAKAEIKKVKARLAELEKPLA